MTLRSINDSKHWRDRGEKMRVLAEGSIDKEAAGAMGRLADDYDKLADRADARTEGGLSRLPSAIPKEKLS